jgi:hypothetical protein
VNNGSDCAAVNSTPRIFALSERLLYAEFRRPKRSLPTSRWLTEHIFTLSNACTYGMAKCTTSCVNAFQMRQVSRPITDYATTAGLTKRKRENREQNLASRVPALRPSEIAKTVLAGRIESFQPKDASQPGRGCDPISVTGLVRPYL